MPYTSSPGGLFDSGIYPDSRPRIDVAGLLQAVGAGTGGIIHQVMQGRIAQQDAEMRRQELQLRQRQDEREANQQNWERGIKERELTQRETTERHNALKSGIVPAEPDVDQTSTQTLPALQAPRVSPIKQAMTPQQMPVQTTPESPAALQIEQHDVRMGAPEHYDPTRSEAYIRSAAVQDLRNQGYVKREEVKAEQQQKRLNAQLQMKVIATEGAKAVANIRANASKSKIGGAMTQGQAEQMRFKVAAGLIDHADGSYDDALDFLENTTEGKALQKEGVGAKHLMYAKGEWNKQQSNAAIRLQAGGVPMVEPEEAVGAVKKTRSLVTPETKGATATPLPPQIKAPPSSSGKRAISKQEFEALKARGFSEEQIRKKYDVTP